MRFLLDIRAAVVLGVALSIPLFTGSLAALADPYASTRVAFNLPGIFNPRAAQTAVENDHVQMTFEGTNLHVCNTGMAMVGVDADNNRFLCAPGFGLNASSDVIVDRHTHAAFNYAGQTHSVHVCPGSSYMVGWNKDRNWLACAGGGRINIAGAHADGPGGTQVPEPRHSSTTMHACNAVGAPLTYAMKGIEYTNNVLICGS